MWNCLLCTPGTTLSNRSILDHVRLFHPDEDASPDMWPDGQIAVYDSTVEEF